MYSVVCSIMVDSWNYCPEWYTDIREFDSYLAAVDFVRNGGDYDLRPGRVYCGNRLVHVSPLKPYYQGVFTSTDGNIKVIFAESFCRKEIERYIADWAKIGLGNCFHIEETKRRPTI